MTTTVKVLADSINPSNDRLTTFQVRVPRVVWSEVMTHRAFSRNASSSRAIPVKSLIAEVEKDPYIPERFGLAKKGMQPGKFVTSADGEMYQVYRSWWRAQVQHAVSAAEAGADLGLHKQVVNRILEPYQYINAVITATDWDNFISLRTELDDAGNPMADIPIYQLACKIRDTLAQHQPTQLGYGEYHIPFAGGACWDLLTDLEKHRVAIARCARVSYVSHDVSVVATKGIQADLNLYDRLEESRHYSPFEHVAMAAGNQRYANFSGFVSVRAQLEALEP